MIVPHDVIPLVPLLPLRVAELQLMENSLFVETRSKGTLKFPLCHIFVKKHYGFGRETLEIKSWPILDPFEPGPFELSDQIGC